MCVDANGQDARLVRWAITRVYAAIWEEGQVWHTETEQASVEAAAVGVHVALVDGNWQVERGAEAADTRLIGVTLAAIAALARHAEPNHALFVGAALAVQRALVGQRNDIRDALPGQASLVRRAIFTVVATLGRALVECAGQTFGAVCGRVAEVSGHRVHRHTGVHLTDVADRAIIAMPAAFEGDAQSVVAD